MQVLTGSPTELSPKQRNSSFLSEAVAEPKPVPLSFAQRRLWFLEQLEPGTPRYHVPLALGLAGPLQVSILEKALNAIVARHEALRTSFPAQDGTPTQVVRP